MNELQIFKHPMFGGLPVIIVDGVEWFGATEAAKALSFGNPYDALKNHVEKDDLADHEVIDRLGRKQQKKFTNESGVYDLIFGAVKQGNNPEIREKAKGFKKWVTHEVLPQIRKTGSYGLPKTFAEALRLAADLEEEKQKLLPKAQYFDALVERNLLTNFRNTAKELKVKEQEFINWLIEEKYIYRDTKEKLRPYGKYVPELFEIKESTRGKWAGIQTLITPKGRETFRLLIIERVNV